MNLEQLPRKIALLSLSLLAFNSISANAYDRIVALTPDVADILVALDSANKVVGKNSFNDHPKLKSVPTVGTHRNITAEAILAVKPDLVLGSYMAQPNSIYRRLNALNVKAVNVAPKEDINSFANSIKQIGSYVNKTTKANRLATNWRRQMRGKPATKTRYLLSYDGRIVAGKGTVADNLIKRAGGINAANFSGLKPLSREGWMAAKPDVIIVADHNKPMLGSVARFSRRPEVVNSPAAKKNKIYFWPANDFLRYGLNSPSVINKLNQLAK